MTLTLLLIAVTCAVSIPCFTNHRLVEKLLFWPPAVARGQVYRFVTHGFVHANSAHLFFNMFTLFFFGRAIERFFVSYIGVAGFIGFYLGGIIAAIVPSYLAHRHDPNYRSLGASGAVSAVLFAFILAAPWTTLYVLVIPVPAIVFAIVYTGWSIYAGRRGGDNVNHSAHLWGAAYGVVFALIMEPGLGPRFLEQIVAF